MLAIGLIYWRGWLALRKTRPNQFGIKQLSAFLLGLIILWVAIDSPLDQLADALLSAHMVEHLLIMSICPPLLLLGQPVVPLIRGIPRLIRRFTLSPLLRMKALRKLAHWLVTPTVAWLAMNLTFLGWHMPRAYDFALEHEFWHAVEHLCFLSTSLLFWWCVLRPWPAPRLKRNWGLLLYLVSADVVNTLLSALLAFSSKPVYGFYVEHPNSFQIPALSDQTLGAVIMWVFGSLVFLIPAMLITVGLLQSERTAA